VREEPHQFRGSMKARQVCMGPRAGKDRVCISLYDEMMPIYARVPQIYIPRRSVHLRFPCISVHPPVAQSISVFPVSPYPPPPHVAQSISVIPVSPYAPCRLPPAKLSGGGGEKQIFPPQRPPSASLSSHDHGLQVHL